MSAIVELQGSLAPITSHLRGVSDVAAKFEYQLRAFLSRLARMAVGAEVCELEVRVTKAVCSLCLTDTKPKALARIHTRTDTNAKDKACVT